LINNKNKTYFFVVISFVCIAFIVGFHILDGRNITLFDPIIEYIKQYHIKDVVNIVAILSGISAILVGVASIRISNLGAHHGKSPLPLRAVPAFPKPFT
jgi:hypothetical protein